MHLRTAQPPIPLPAPKHGRMPAARAFRAWISSIDVDVQITGEDRAP